MFLMSEDNVIDIKLTSKWENFGSKSTKTYFCEPLFDNNSYAYCYAQKEEIIKKIKRNYKIDNNKRSIDIGIGIHDFDLSKTNAKDEVVVFDYLQKVYDDKHNNYCDFECWDSVDKCFDKFFDGIPTIYYLLDVLSQMDNVLVILAKLRNLLLNNRDNKLIITIADRYKNNKEGYNGYPKKNFYRREWTKIEIENFLLSSGFAIEDSGYLDDEKNVFLKVSCNEEHYKKFLIENNLPGFEKDEIVFFADYKDNFQTKLHKKSFIDKFRGYIVCVSDYLSKRKIDRTDFGCEHIVAKIFFTDKYIKKLANLDCNKYVLPKHNINNYSRITLELCSQMLYFYPLINKVFYQDRFGIGMRIAQAKKTFLLPNRLNINVLCIGTYMDEVKQRKDIMMISDMYIACLEKNSVEDCDECIIFEKNMIENYRRYGFNMVPEKITLFDDFKKTKEKNEEIRKDVFNNIVEENNLVDIIIPVYKTELRYIQDCCYGINCQKLQPNKVIFVDEGSDSEYSKSLYLTVEKSLKVNFEIIKQDINREGAAGARNTGVFYSKAKYVITLDADDVPINDIFYKCVYFLEKNEDYDAVCGMLFAFNKDEDYKKVSVDYNKWHFDSFYQGTSLGLLKNTLMGPFACFKRSVYVDVGGCDDTEKRAGYEEWAFWLKLTGYNKKIAIMPTEAYLYRLLDNGKAKTDDLFLGRFRVARNVINNSIFDNIIFQDLGYNLYKFNSLFSAFWEDIPNVLFLVYKNFFEGKKILIFGAGEEGRHFFIYMKKLKISMSGFIDNDKNKQGKKIREIGIYSLESICKKFDNNVFIVIASDWSKQIVKQLKDIGFEKNIDFIVKPKFDIY